MVDFLQGGHLDDGVVDEIVADEDVPYGDAEAVKQNFPEAVVGGLAVRVQVAELGQLGDI